MEYGLENRIAIVTGSSQGIGKAIAHGLAREGAQVIICARNERKLRETAKEIESSTEVPVLFFRVDLNNEDEIRCLVEKTINYRAVW